MTDDYDALSREVQEQADARSSAAEITSKPTRNVQVPVLIGLVVVWAGVGAWTVSRLPASAPPATYQERVHGAVVDLESAAGFVDVCLEADPPQLPASLPEEHFPEVSFEAKGEKAYGLTLEVDGEPIGLHVAEDGSRSFSGKGTEAFKGGDQ